MIETERLEIKPWLESQTQDFFNLTQDNGFNLHLITIYRQTDHASALNWIRTSIQLYNETRLGKWGVWEKSTGSLIGIGGLTPWQYNNENLVDITYRLRETAWGKGYGLEIAKALCDHAFQKLNLSEITATVTPDNAASKKILEKLGMKFDRRILLLDVETDLFRLKKADFSLPRWQ
ncbi:GNAT family N-acetyltransferase [Bdellovibrio sp. BCCA]|uniref:GNAT family N-acetyltransferase n=1 Tax=Bdellovibrio sp. BCCA TaxID=3136281 RepID=UPI0030F0194E